MVRLAPQGVSPQPSPVASTLLGSAENLSVRVNRLLDGVVPRYRTYDSHRFVVGTALVLLMVCLAGVGERPSTLRGLHHVLERFHRAGSSGLSRS